MSTEKEQQKPRYLYVLRCKSDKYYVGTTYDVSKRFLEHVNTKPTNNMKIGSAWTVIHEPLEITFWTEIKTHHDEDNKTLDLMRKHGIQNVRGGSFTSVELPEYQFKTISDQICTIEQKCFLCRQPGHIASQCPRN